MGDNRVKTAINLLSLAIEEDVPVSENTLIDRLNELLLPGTSGSFNEMLQLEKQLTFLLNKTDKSRVQTIQGKLERERKLLGKSEEEKNEIRKEENDVQCNVGDEKTLKKENALLLADDKRLGPINDRESCEYEKSKTTLAENEMKLSANMANEEVMLERSRMIQEEQDRRDYELALRLAPECNSQVEELILPVQLKEEDENKNKCEEEIIKNEIVSNDNEKQLEESEKHKEQSIKLQAKESQFSNCHLINIENRKEDIKNVAHESIIEIVEDRLPHEKEEEELSQRQEHNFNSESLVLQNHSNSSTNTKLIKECEEGHGQLVVERTTKEISTDNSLEIKIVPKLNTYPLVLVPDKNDLPIIEHGMGEIEVAVIANEKADNFNKEGKTLEGNSSIPSAEQSVKSRRNCCTIS